jgi:hypothetical protein
MPSLLLLSFATLLTITAHANSMYAQVHDEYDFQWSHSLYPPYVDSHGESANWAYDAFISASESYVRLTVEKPSQHGYIVSKTVPVHAHSY